MTIKRFHQVHIILLACLAGLLCGAGTIRAEDATGVKPPAPANAPAAKTAAAAAQTNPDSTAAPTGPIDPNGLLPEQRTAWQTQSPSDKNPLQQPNQSFWRQDYHPQVTSRVFTVLCYPYYHGGKPYRLDDPPAELAISAALAAATAATADTALGDPNHSDPAGTLVAAEIDDANQLRQHLESCCDWIHQWRCLNESPGVALEIVRAIELTRRTTGIYHLQPDLAVRVKRTLGHIGRLNQQYDLTARIVLAQLAAGRTDKILLARLEKKLSDLQALLEQLGEQDDAICVALGIGVIDRRAEQAAAYKPIYYTNLGLPNVPAELFQDKISQ
ncbi:MAG: hypothetical protein JW810_03640 [Sedimentisphaerales bacterium]|nr:hypothetical protein [Sedimentisphaerales bacterium]